MGWVHTQFSILSSVSLYGMSDNRIYFRHIMISNRLGKIMKIEEIAEVTLFMLTQWCSSGVGFIKLDS